MQNDLLRQYTRAREPIVVNINYNTERRPAPVCNIIGLDGRRSSLRNNYYPSPPLSAVVIHFPSTLDTAFDYVAVEVVAVAAVVAVAVVVVVAFRVFLSRPLRTRQPPPPHHNASGTTTTSLKYLLHPPSPRDFTRTFRKGNSPRKLADSIIARG